MINYEYPIYFWISYNFVGIEISQYASWRNYIHNNKKLFKLYASFFKL